METKRIENSIEFPQSVGQVFDFFTSTERWRSLPGIELTQSSPDYLRHGDSFLATWRSPFGKSVVTRYVVTDYEPNRFFKYESDAASTRIQLKYTNYFEPVQSGTRLTQIIELESKGLFTWTGLIERSAMRGLESMREGLDKADGAQHESQ